MLDTGIGISNTISIHTPREGSDSAIFNMALGLNNFNPHSP